MLFMGSDHAGFSLKQALIQKYQDRIELNDLGTNSEESCDYPDYALKVAEAVKRTPDSFGLLICGTGVGMSIAANKVCGIRAACVSEEKSAEMARKHNNAQILCLGSRIIDIETASKCLDIFLSTSFDSGHERHQRRLQKIQKIEEQEGRCS